MHLNSLVVETGARDAYDWMHRLYTQEWPRPRASLLARTVDGVALDGDPVAREILLNAAQQLAMLAVSVRRRLFRPGEAASVCYIGGVFQSGMLLERFRQLVELEDGSRAGPPRYEPAAGPFLEAYRAAGLHPALSHISELTT